jgi:hypothetical protein
VILKYLTIVGVVCFTAACAETRYVKLGEADETTNSPYRIVKVEMSEELIHSYPECVTIMPVIGKYNGSKGSQLVELSLSRHLHQKITRVIGPIERDYVARGMAADLGNSHDRQDVLTALSCEALLAVEVVEPEASSLLVWSRVRLGLDVKLMRWQDSKVLWRAKHIGQRSGGGFPVSIFGVVTETYQSANFASDREVLHSMIDDVVRRIVASLPNGMRIRNRTVLKVQ